jgi:hypothetical protein
MEHALHLAGKHFIEGVALTPASKLLQKVKGTIANGTGDDDEIDMDVLNLELEDIKAERGEDAEDEEGKDYDTISTALALFTQV